MSRTYVLECRIDLPDDPHDMSEIISKTREPWNNLVSALQSSGVNFQPKSDLRTKLGQRKQKAQPETQPPALETA